VSWIAPILTFEMTPLNPGKSKNTENGSFRVLEIFDVEIFSAINILRVDRKNCEIARCGNFAIIAPGN
jgi:hypothetical protein